jgi:hypothetical protein
MLLDELFADPTMKRADAERSDVDVVSGGINFEDGDWLGAVLGNIDDGVVSFVVALLV